jgi:hypothetical protein
LRYRTGPTRWEQIPELPKRLHREPHNPNLPQDEVLKKVKIRHFGIEKYISYQLIPLMTCLLNSWTGLLPPPPLQNAQKCEEKRADTPSSCIEKKIINKTYSYYRVFASGRNMIKARRMKSCSEDALNLFLLLTFLKSTHFKECTRTRY